MVEEQVDAKLLDSAADKGSAPTERSGKRVGGCLLGAQLPSEYGATQYEAEVGEPGGEAVRVLLWSGDKTAALSRLARFSHPHSVEVREVGLSGDETFLVTESTEGEALSSCLIRDGALPAEHICRVGIQIGAALREAHQVELWHSDLNAERISIIGSDLFVKVHHFGIASALGEKPHALTIAPTQPETSSAQADIYAFGVLLHQMMSGRMDRPSGVERGPELSGNAVKIGYEELDLLVERCCASTDQRYEHVNDIIEDLRAVQRFIELATLPDLSEGPAAPGSKDQETLVQSKLEPIPEAPKRPGVELPQIAIVVALACLISTIMFWFLVAR